MANILITGAGSGFCLEAALKLAEKGHHVIAGVEIISQVTMLQDEAKKRGLSLQVEKLDVTDPADRQKAWNWEIDVLLNNAGIAEGGAVADIPVERIRRQFEVNVFGPIALTQGFARKMVAAKKGKIVFLSSVAGLSTDPFAGSYSASKHALEAFAEALHKEMQEFGVQVATINPGPYLTGFNDRMLDRWKEWTDDPAERVFDYSKIAFPHEQYDPAPVVETIVAVLSGETDAYRNLLPESAEKVTKAEMEEKWTRKQNSPQGSRHELVEKAYTLQPATPAKE